MARILYDLALADPEVRPSPYCWTVKFALLHKGLAFETKPVPFADKSQYPDADYGKVPVLADNGELVKDSAAITAWLDRKYPDSPLVASKAERAAADFMSAWVAAALYPALAPFLALRVARAARESDQAYFRSTREARFGKSLEALAATPDADKRAEAALAVLAGALAHHRYLGGPAPNLSDYIAFGPLMWQRSVTSAELYATPDPVAQWRERMLDLYGGYARAAKSAGAA
jgi:glutathione S-transferase